MTHHIAYVRVDGADEEEAVENAAAVMDENVGDKREGYAFDGADLMEHSSRYDIPTVRRAGEMPRTTFGPEGPDQFVLGEDDAEWVVAFDVHR